MNTALIVIILLIACVLICQVIDRIKRRHIEDKIDELKLKVWLNENHFDYRGLIDRGLAVKVKTNKLRMKIGSISNQTPITK